MKIALLFDFEFGNLSMPSMNSLSLSFFSFLFFLFGFVELFFRSGGGTGTQISGDEWGKKINSQSPMQYIATQPIHHSFFSLSLSFFVTFFFIGFELSC